MLALMMPVVAMVATPAQLLIRNKDATMFALLHLRSRAMVVKSFTTCDCHLSSIQLLPGLGNASFGTKHATICSKKSRIAVGGRRQRVQPIDINRVVRLSTVASGVSAGSKYNKLHSANIKVTFEPSFGSLAFPNGHPAADLGNLRLFSKHWP